MHTYRMLAVNTFKGASKEKSNLFIFW